MRETSHNRPPSNAKKPRKYGYLTNCVGADGDAIRTMKNHADCRAVCLDTMRKHCEMDELVMSLGYSRKFHLCNDWLVRYYSSWYEGQWCYFMVHSAIEYIFVRKEFM